MHRLSKFYKMLLYISLWPSFSG